MYIFIILHVFSFSFYKILVVRIRIRVNKKSFVNFIILFNMNILLFILLTLIYCLSYTHAKTRPASEIARVPPRGFSSWVTFRLYPNETLVKEIADVMNSSGLLSIGGYDILWIDDGWSECLSFESNGKCIEPAPRDNNGKIVPSATKFPNGMLALSNYVHSKGLKLGIYTAVSARTCGGYIGSLYNEVIDADTFINDWQLDAVKSDTCNTDCPIHTGCIQNSTYIMWNALDTLTERPIIYYIDSGNPTSPQRVYNPLNYHVSDLEAIYKLAINYKELVWNWAGISNTTVGVHAHMFKSWFDREDNWYSVLDNLHNQIRIAEYQTCGTFNMPDYLTIGMGGQSQEQYMAQFAAWVVLGAPLFISNDIRNMDNWTLNILTNTEALAINSDSLCIQGSQAMNFDATETWIKPLNDTSFAVAIINKDPIQTLNVTVSFESGGAFFPAAFLSAQVRDIFMKSNFSSISMNNFTVAIPPLGGRLYKVIPLS